MLNNRVITHTKTGYHLRDAGLDARELAREPLLPPLSGEISQLSISEKRGRFDARHLERPAASYVFTSCLIVQQNHVTGGFGKLRSVALVRLPGQPVHFSPHQPPQFVAVGGPAKRAVESHRLANLRFTVEGFFVHGVYLFQYRL